ncbi:MAG: hypothetical protein EB015_12290 [Methylocystaceae bacterium]|nr:hypothetical protein [Methylocystaceae bacterium]
MLSHVKHPSLTFALAIALALAPLKGFANEAPPKPKPEEKPAAPPKPSGLTGNLMPHCEPGSYPAGNRCKPAPPGYYAPANTKYPVPCPDGKSSPFGARGKIECK